MLLWRNMSDDALLLTDQYSVELMKVDQKELYCDDHEEEEEEDQIQSKKMMMMMSCYPAAVATHEDMVRNDELFMEVLNSFHSLLGTNLMIPLIGGEELNLHMLYVEVTNKGGLEQVINRKKWKEVSCAFSFPPTTTSSTSFLLRKYYTNLLHHFENVYFSNKEPEGTIPPQVSTTRRRLPSADPLQIPVLGVIDGKFDHGYLVTVRVGLHVLHGVLYHIPDIQQDAMCTNNVNSDMPRLGKYSNEIRKRKRWDANHPKPVRSGYNFFFSGNHSKFKLEFPALKEQKLCKMIGESWSKLTEEEKLVYQEYGARDKERYNREMQEYREIMKLIQPMDAVSEKTTRKKRTCRSHA